ncbi:MAG: hypothetical protein KJ893_04370 [Candidatus Omnitrophica bacterium]|nr:hypothetical protein [Candidatus Omnitrophota bacterium]MBU4580757.1 hypothetical protein [Patescibacteria group bacterium]
MALSGTEADIINCVARLRLATKDQIRRDVGFSLDYMGFLCRYLVRKGYLNFSQGHYSLAKAGIKTLLTEESRIDRELIKEVAGEVAKEISGELRKTVKGIKIPVSVREIKKEAEERLEDQIKIKTDFDFPIEDESLTLESNIDKIGTRVEKEKSDIDKSVELFKKFKKRGKR